MSRMHHVGGAIVGCAALAVVLGVFLASPSDAQAKEWESQEHNVIVTIPEGAKAWDWLPYNSAWSKLDIVKGAQRELKELKSGEPAKGHGAVMFVAVRDADEGATLADLRDDKKVREFLLGRFKTHEDVKVEEYTVLADGNGEHPCLVFRTKGEGYNLKGKVARAEGILLATLARGKLYLVSLYAFPTEYDPEGLVVDINHLEGNGFALITAKEDTKKVDPKKGPPKKAGEAADPAADEEAEQREDQVLFWADLECRIVRDKKLEPLELNAEDRDFNLIFKCADSDTHGSYVFYIYAPPTVQYIDGVQAPAANILKWITVDWWNHFTNTHPKGELATYDWPRKPSRKRAKTFLTLPDITDEKEREVVFEADDKRPAEVDASDMRKMGFVEKVKRNNIGRKGKVSEAVRGCMEGKNALNGRMETVFRWAFRYGPSGNSYRVFVVFSGEGYKKWGAAIRKTLESWEFGIEEE